MGSVVMSKGPKLPILTSEDGGKTVHPLRLLCHGDPTIQCVVHGAGRRAITGWCRRVLSTTEGPACGWGLVQEGEIAEFVYLVNSFIAPSLENFSCCRR